MSEIIEKEERNQEIIEGVENLIETKRGLGYKI